MMEIKKKELLAVMKTFRKDKSPSLDGWTIEFFLAFFYLLGDDILKMEEEMKDRGSMLSSLNTTFIALSQRLIF